MRHASPLPFYLLVGAAATFENVAPLSVADLIVLFGAFLVATSHSGWLGVFLVAWIGNTGGAAGLFALARHYRKRRPESRVVQWLLARHGTGDEGPPRHWDLLSVFLGSFLPVRPWLPIHAGLGGIPFWRLIVPVGAAAGAWYVGLVFVGATGGRNFGEVSRAFAAYNREFLLAAALLLLSAATWWLVRRRRRRR